MAPLFCAAAFWTIAACGPWSNAGVRQVVVMEAGGAVPEAAAFAVKPDDAGRAFYASDVSSVDIHTLGDRPVSINIGEKKHEAVLRVADTTPPSGRPREVTVVSGSPQAPDAAAFVTDITDVTAVRVYYKRQPDFKKPGARDVTVTLEDEGGNKTDLTARLNVVGAKPLVQVEAGESESLDPQLFIDAPASAADYMTVELISGGAPAQLRTPGEYDILISADGVELSSKLAVTDTTPPSATAVDRAATPGAALEPLDFTADLYDISPVTARFAKAPDFTALGEREVVIIIEDAFGNKTELTAVLAVRESIIPPVISGASDITIFAGDNVSYKKGVSAKDSKGAAVTVEVDAEAADLRTSGSYPVIYSAVDSHGNKAVETVTLTVLDIDEQSVNKMADDILKDIIKDDMNLEQKARAIFNWVITNVYYVSTGDKDSVVKLAYHGFRARQGDCFTFYAVSEVMLTRVGIDNMMIERVGGRTGHYWNLINIGTGWYHFDTTPFKMPFYTFMFTESEAEKYTRLRTDVKNCYVYDKSLYPEVVYGDGEP
ncbi:MAG: hypothetical protein FWH06_00430 [Oscillospiraceae bacterium]|nr:hypothetical protein [Oscillospiraceae bacterium]